MYANVYPDAHAQLVIVIMNATAALTLAVGVALFYLVLFKSPKSMKLCKYYLLGYVASSLGTEAMIACIKPILMEPLSIFYFAGWCSTVTWAGAVTETIAFFALGFTLLICYGTLILDRILATTLLSAHRRGRLVFAVFILSWCIGLTAFGLFCWIAIASGVAISSEQMHLQLREQIDNAETLIASGTGLFGLSVWNLWVSGYFFAVVFGFVAGTAAVSPAFFILWIFYTKRKPTYVASKTRHVNAMIVRVCVAQLVGIGALVVVPAFVLACVTMLFRVNIHTGQYCAVLINSFMLYDMLVLIVCIRPYRDAFTNFVHCVKKTESIDYTTAFSSSDQRRVSMFVAVNRHSRQTAWACKRQSMR